MSLTLRELAVLVHGDLRGDGDTPITAPGTLSDVRAGQITFIDAAEKIERLLKTPAAAAVVPVGCAVDGLPTIAVAEVHAAFKAIVLHFRPPRPRVRRGVHPRAFVSPTARLADDVEVGPGATIGDDVEIAAGTTVHAGVQILAGCRIGPDVTIFPNAVLYEDTLVGPRCIIHGGAVLGAYGFGYKVVEGRHQLVPQLGHVELEADVEIGAVSTVDRGVYGATIVGQGTKVDNLVQIAHNCRIGKHNLICSQVGVAGSTTTGDYVVMAGQVGVRDHVHIGERAVLGAMSGVLNDIPAGEQWLGIPATPHREQMLKQAALAKLPEMRRQLKALEATVARLSAEAEGRNREAA